MQGRFRLVLGGNRIALRSVSENDNAETDSIGKRSRLGGCSTFTTEKLRENDEGPNVGDTRVSECIL
jgi:hypothetical protein